MTNKINDWSTPPSHEETRGANNRLADNDFTVQLQCEHLQDTRAQLALPRAACSHHDKKAFALC